jgi:anthraniloyl-CoA monooxygenase
VRVAVIGGGPGGLYAAALLKHLDPGREVTVWERNAPDDTFGFGVVLSDETLGGIEHADPVVYAALQDEFVRWDDIDIVHRGVRSTSGGTASRRSAGAGSWRSCTSAAARSASSCASGPRPRPSPS